MRRVLRRHDWPHDIFLAMPERRSLSAMHYAFLTSAFRNAINIAAAREQVHDDHFRRAREAACVASDTTKYQRTHLRYDAMRRIPYSDDASHSANRKETHTYDRRNLIMPCRILFDMIDFLASHRLRRRGAIYARIKP